MSSEPIRVKDLLEYLSTCHPDDLVVLATDEEGNSFSPLADITYDMYHDRSVALRALTPKLEAEGYTQEEVGTPEQGYESCVTLWPTH